MTPEDALRQAARSLDEATENITFDEFAWAFEEGWSGVAWVLNALQPRPDPTLNPGEPGQLPRPGTLLALLAGMPNPPRTASVVDQMESLRQTVELPEDLRQWGSSVVDLVFAAWELHDEVSLRLGLVDDRLGDGLMLAEVSPGRIGSRVLHRRDALKVLLAGSALPIAACRKVERDNSVPEPQAPTASPVAEAPPAARVKAVSALDRQIWPTTDPFLFCAYHLDDYPAGNESMGPAASLDGRMLGRDFVGKDNWRMYHGRTVPGFPRHPHRGFETVTVVRSGLLDHSDSLGATARYGGGDVQWLTAGRGIQHAEMFPLVNQDRDNPLELFQIWLNLPASDKMVDPYFTMLWNERIPRVTETDETGRVTEVTIAAGQYKGKRPPSPPPNSWASRPTSELAIWTLRMEAGAEFVVPPVSAGTRRSLYVHAGTALRIGDRDVDVNQRAEVDDVGPLTLVAGKDQAEVLLLQGRPIGEPVAKRGPFVMNTQAEIRQAYSDYRTTQFGGWPWDANGPVHERVKGRFARHIDGRFEEPT